MISEMGNKSQKHIIAILLLLAALGGLWTVTRFIYFTLTPHKQGVQEEVILLVPRKTTPTELSNRLFENGVVSDARRFFWLGRLTRQWPKMKAGEYLFSPGMTPLEVLALITSGRSVTHPLTVREGENIYEIAVDLEAKGLADRKKFIKLCRDKTFIAKMSFTHSIPPSLEGYLFPDTYNLTRLMSSEEIIELMARRFFEVWNESYELRARELGLTRHAVVTLASMIEKETGASGERAMISSVFHNRLKKNMRLQSDPTTIYGIWDRYQGNLRKSDLLEKNPYNTYMISGLPAGPIGNPGKASIDAALYPLKSENLFFVSHNDGTHEFTKNFNDHQRAVKRFQLNPKAREGKSWRDLNRK